jgi:hypothetical protein
MFISESTVKGITGPHILFLFGPTHTQDGFFFVGSFRFFGVFRVRVAQIPVQIAAATHLGVVLVLVVWCLLWE